MDVGKAMGVRLLSLVRQDEGQAAVEAAFALPVFMLLVLMLVQPGIVLYDRVIMQAAAAEGCRLLATAQADGLSAERCEDYIRRRLGAVPQQDCFHVHGAACSWDIEMVGGESSTEVSVRIGNQLKPLPLFDGAATLLGLCNAEGNLEIEVEASLPTQAGWVTGSAAGSNPSAWVGAWLDGE